MFLYFSSSKGKFDIIIGTLYGQALIDEGLILAKIIDITISIFLNGAASYGVVHSIVIHEVKTDLLVLLIRVQTYYQVNVEGEKNGSDQSGR